MTLLAVATAVFPRAAGAFAAAASITPGLAVGIGGLLGGGALKSR